MEYSDTSSRPVGREVPADNLLDNLPIMGYTRLLLFFNYLI